MKTEGHNIISFSGIQPFYMSVKYIELQAFSAENQFDSHIHNECEIYINISGDVEFMVENKVYPISPGSVIITRPSEYHHCIYRSNAVHRHFWILFSCEGNEQLYDIFFGRRKGVGNLILLDASELKNVRGTCKKLIDGCSGLSEQFMLFFNLIGILQNGTAGTENISLPDDVDMSIKYIRNNLSSRLTVSELALFSHTSINSLERHFNDALQISPVEYIKKCRLVKAEELLKTQLTVQEISDSCGFSDCSHFIVQFKKQFGTTPFRYRNEKALSVDYRKQK